MNRMQWAPLTAYELKKCITTPAFWVYTMLCLSLNTLFLTNDGNPSEVNAFSRDLVASGKQWTDGEDVFDHYDASTLADTIVDTLDLTGLLETAMRAKYAKLQTVVDSFADQDVGLDIYAGIHTKGVHGRLFQKTLKLVTTETILLAVLVVLYLYGYERNHKTEALVYSSRTGRGVVKYKRLAGFLCTLGGFFMIGGYTLTVYFTIWDYTGYWNANVSSQFNFIRDAATGRPFITWNSFTVLRYFLAVTALSLLLVVVFFLMGSVLGLLMGNAYMAFLAFVLFSATMTSFLFLFPQMGFVEGYFTILCLPTSLWYTQSQWLTDMGVYSLLPYHETFAMLANLIVLSFLSMVANRKFKRKDLA